MTPFHLTRRAAIGQLGASAALLALPIPARAAEAGAPAAPGTTTAALDAIAWNLLALFPEQATSLGVDTDQHSALRHQLEDRSPAGRAKTASVLRETLQRLKAIPAADLDANTATTVSVIRSACTTALDGFALPYGEVAVGGWRNSPYPVIQNVGAYLDTPRLLDGDHPIRTADDAEAYLDRLAAFPVQLDGELARLRSAARIGAIAPDFLLDKTILQLRQVLGGAQGGGDLVSSLVRRTAGIPGNWEKRARAIVTGPVALALFRQLSELKVQRLHASSQPGLWARPQGREWYAWALRASTTTRHSPEDVHAMGLDQVRVLQDRMDPILRGLGFTSGSVGERLAALGKDPRYQFTNDAEGRAEIIALMEKKIAFIRTRLPLAFRNLVPGNLEIRRLPLAEEGGAAGAYGGPGSIDGKIPGKIWLNLANTERFSRFGVATLAFHEGIPGHVWQGEYANRLPLIRSMLAFNAYSEGWALYAETLGDELGAYDGDPVGQLGYLQSLSFRACRMVVDTGLHAKRWTRAAAIDWFASTNGSGLAEVAPEVDRYCAWPGQACGYKIGHSEILALRDKATAALGERYDLRDFNNVVVSGGNVPLDVLGANVARYIAANKVT